MRGRKAPTLVCAACLAVLFCPAAISAQISSALNRCPPYPSLLPYPTLADEIGDLRDEVRAKSGAPALPEKTVIDDVNFDDATWLSDSFRDRIRPALTQYKIRNDDVGWLQKLQDDVVMSELQDDGFFKAQRSVTSEIIRTDAAAQHILLRIHVGETSQYTLGEVTFRSADPDIPLVLPQEELRELLQLSVGDIFAAAKIRAGMQAMHSLYGSKGYVDFVATPLIHIDDTQKRVAIVFEIEQEKQFRIAQVEVFSLDAATENRLKSQLAVGDIFNILLVDEFVKSNQWVLPPGASRANLEVHRNVNAGTVDLLFNFRSCPSLQHEPTPQEF